MADMEQLNALSERVIGLAIQVHRELGSGLLESTCWKNYSGPWGAIINLSKA